MRLGIDAHPVVGVVACREVAARIRLKRSAFRVASSGEQ